MPFFIKKRKSKSSSGGDEIKKTKRNTYQAKSQDPDEEIESDSNDELSNEKDAIESSEEDWETPQEKKLRLAKEYLLQTERELSDEDGENKDVGGRLKQQYLAQKGRLHKPVAANYIKPNPEDVVTLRGHQLPVTCVAITSDDKFIFSGSKDCSIIKWDVSSGRKLKVIPGGRKGTEKTHVGHTYHVLALALSTDSKFLASGDSFKLIKIWNVSDCSFLQTFTGHRSAITGLIFRIDSYQLFSASQDRTIKVWSLDEMTYVETLFGHQDGITSIDCLMKEKAITSGGRDSSLRIWKIIEESQLVFHGHTGSIDCVSLIDESHFVSGGDDNSIGLWSTMKKKPTTMVKNAHNSSESTEDNQPAANVENWIITVASLTNTDLVASGSRDGYVRFWMCSNGFKQIQQLFALPLCGFVNSLRFSNNGSFLVAGVGQEHKLGRWWREKTAKNSIAIIKLKKKNGT